MSYFDFRLSATPHPLPFGYSRGQDPVDPGRLTCGNVGKRTERASLRTGYKRAKKVGESRSFKQWLREAGWKK